MSIWLKNRNISFPFHFIAETLVVLQKGDSTDSRPNLFPCFIVKKKIKTQQLETPFNKIILILEVIAIPYNFHLSFYYILGKFVVVFIETILNFVW